MKDGRPEVMIWLWMGLVASVSVGLSHAFACVMPFTAIAVLAAFTLPPRKAAGLVLFAWAANQAVGFGLLHYPMDPPTIAWGLVIGLAAFAGLLTATSLTRLRQLPAGAALALSLPLAFASYEGVLLLATTVLPSGSGAFAPMLLAQMLAWNAAATLALLIPYRLAFRTSRFCRTPFPSSPEAAGPLPLGR